MLTIIIILALTLLCTSAHANTVFGLSWGMTPEQVKAAGVELIDEKADVNGVMYRTKSLPQNLPDADFYVLLFGKKEGLAKIVSLLKDITDDAYGIAGKKRFKELSQTLSKKYKKEKDYIYTGMKLYDEYDEFYQCLAYQGCGSHATVFSSESQDVFLELHGLNRGKGYIKISMEAVPAWSDIVDKRREIQKEQEAEAL